MDQSELKRICKWHSKQILMIQYSDKLDYQEICIDCVKKHKILEFIGIEEIVKSDENSIFYDYPLLNDKCIMETLNEMNINQNQIQELQNKMNQYVEELEKQFAQAVEILKGQIKTKISTLNQYKNKVIEKYNVVSNKGELKNILKYEKDDINDDLKKIFQLQKQNITQNTQIMKEAIKDYDSLIKKFNSSQPEQILQNIINSVKSINFFSLDEFSHKPVKQSEKENILELIKNKTNYCSEEYLQFINEYLNNLTNINQNQEDFAGKTYNKQKRERFQIMSQEKLDKLGELCELISLQESATEEEKFNQQIKTFKIKNNILNIQKWVNQLSISNEMTELFPEIQFLDYSKMSYDITDLVEFQSQSSNFQSIEHSEQGIQIKQLKYGNKLSFCNFNLDINTNYIFRINIQSNSNSQDTFILFGLILNKLKESKLLCNLKISYCESNDKEGIGKIVKGQKLCQGNNSNINRTFEMRINIGNQILKVADYPKYENVSEVTDKNKIQISGLYRFGVELAYKDDKATINQVLIVPEFDDLM